MATSRPSRPSLIIGTVGIVATVVTAVVVVADAGPLALVVQVLAGAAVVAALVGTVAGLPAWGTVMAGLLGASFLATLHERAPAVDARTPPSWRRRCCSSPSS